MWNAPKDLADSWGTLCASHVASGNYLEIRRAECARGVFDHVELFQADIYMAFARQQLDSKIVQAAILACQEWDGATGGDPVYSTEFGLISLTACKYIALLAKVWYTLGRFPSHVVEIGGGLGGFAHVFMRVTGCRYDVIDLPDTAAAISGILTALGHTSFGCFGADQSNTFSSMFTQRDAFFVSEHALSECPSSIRNAYIETVVSRCSAGWISNNDLPNHDALSQALQRQGKHVQEEPDVYCSNATRGLSWK